MTGKAYPCDDFHIPVPARQTAEKHTVLV